MPVLIDIITKGATDQGLTLRMVDSTDGTLETGVTSATSGLDVWYRRQGGAKVSLTESDLSALTDAHADGGLLHISDGEYRVDFPDAAFASGADWVDVGWGATGMVGFGGRVRLIAANLEDATRLGLTALPDAAADAAGGLPISDAGGLDLDTVGANVAAVLLDTGTDGVVVAAGSKSGYTISGTLTTLDALDTAQDSQHSTTQVAIAALNDLSDVDVWSYANRVLTANTNLNDPTAAAIADAVWDEATAGHVSAGTFGKLGNDLATSVADILADTAEIGAAGAGLTEAGGTGDQFTAIPWNAAWDAEVESEANDALVALKLDHLVAVADADDAVDNSIVAKLASATGDWSTFNGSTMALEASKTEHDTTQSAIAALNDIDAAAVLDATIAEPTSLPAWGSMSLRKIAQVLGVDMLNKIDSDADSVDVWNAAEDTILWSHASSDDGTTFTSAKAA